MGSRGPPDIGGLISLKVDNFPFDMTCARPQHRGAPRHPRPQTAVTASARGYCASARTTVSTRTARRNEALREMFSAYGEVADCYMPRNHATGHSRGFGFVRFREEAEAEAAMKGCDGVVIDGSAPLHLGSAPPAPLHLCTSAPLHLCPRQARPARLDRPARAPYATHGSNPSA